MLSEESLDRYRAMTLSERLDLVLQMIRDEVPLLLSGPPDVVDRRFDLLRRENDLRNQAMLEGIARSKARHE